jgi:hypothetical protein
MPPNSGTMFDTVVARLMRQLYRARPFTKAIPFNKTLPVASVDDFIELWLPNNAYFELVFLSIKASAAADLNFCDTNQQNPFLFVQPSTTEYTLVGIPPGYRSQSPINAKVIVTNPGLVVGTIKGVIYGYEVTPEGSYR